MEGSEKMGNVKAKVLFGIIIILFGVSLLLENLGIAEIDFGYIMSIFLPVVLILWAVNILFKRQGLASIITSIILILIGSSILGENLGWFQLDLSIIWKFFWPIIFILIGINILSGGRKNAKSKFAIMSGIDKSRTPWDLEGGAYTAFMGGIELDLNYAKMPLGETTIELTAVMGGIDVIVPEDLQVHCTGTVILGGLEFFKRGTGGLISSIEAMQEGDNSKILHIKSTAIMGGIEIKSKNTK